MERCARMLALSMKAAGEAKVTFREGTLLFTRWIQLTPRRGGGGVNLCILQHIHLYFVLMVNQWLFI